LAKIDKKAPKDHVSTPKYATQEIYAIYDKALTILDHGVKVGYSNAPQGYMAQTIVVELLHGGAYAVPINQLPFFLNDPTQSPYYAGSLNNVTSAVGGGPGWGTDLINWILGQASTNGAMILTEIIMDANVPHVLPKLISDQSYGVFMLTFSHLSNTNLFTAWNKGLTSLVEGTIVPLAGVGEEMSKAAIANTEQLVKLAGPAAEAAATVLG
jgi:hypothetical protein